jgi:hypothetical protein
MSPLLGDVSQLSIGSSDILDRLTDGVDSLRRIELPSIDSGPREILDCLMNVRAALDAIEERLTSAIRFRSRIRDAHKISLGEYEDAWAQATGAAAKRGRGSSGWGEPAPRERYAESDLLTLDQANDAVDLISRSYRSLDEVRKDLHLMLRAINVESSLER